MARQTKRIKKNIQAAQELEEEMLHADAPRTTHKPWENLVLVAVICMTLFLLASSWEIMTNLNRGMYGSLAIGLLLMYVQRRNAEKFTPAQTLWLNRGTFAFIILSLILFGCAVYFDHFAS